MKCANCGAYIDNSAKFCQYCGTPNDAYAAPKQPEPVQNAPFYQAPPQPAPVNVYVNSNEYHESAPKQKVIYVEKPVARSEKSRVVLLVLLLLFGELGIHKFYQGKTGMGVLYLFTCGIFGIGWLVDIFSVLLGHPKDKYGLPIMW